jgi:VWFA-related protein
MAALERLSWPTGGRVFEVSRKTPLEQILREFGEEMRSQYGLGFRPPAGGKEGQFHKLEVKSTMAGVKVQARSGYYSGRKR